MVLVVSNLCHISSSPLLYQGRRFRGGRGCSSPPTSSGEGAEHPHLSHIVSLSLSHFAHFNRQANLVWVTLFHFEVYFSYCNRTNTHTLQYKVLELSLSLYSVLSTSGLIECQDWYDSTSPMCYTHTPHLHTCTHSNPVQRVEISFCL